MSAGSPTTPPSTGRRPQPNGRTGILKFINCEAIDSAVQTIPPALVDKLCKDELLPPVSSEAVFIEELLAIAKKLNRAHLVTIVKSNS